MTANEHAKLGAILLAAGDSTRLGQPKQLLKFEGETLLRRAARSLADSVYFPVVVVLGAEVEASPAEIEGLPVYSVLNDDWQSGMSSSIRAGVAGALEREPDLDGILIALCDQPKISTEMLNRFAARFCDTGASVVAALYNNIAGVPALFAAPLFGELLKLGGDKGARQLIRDRPDVLTIDLPEAAFDIDSPADLAPAR